MFGFTISPLHLFHCFFPPSFNSQLYFFLLSTLTWVKFKFQDRFWFLSFIGKKENTGIPFFLNIYFGIGFQTKYFKWNTCRILLTFMVIKYISSFFFFPFSKQPFIFSLSLISLYLLISIAFTCTGKHSLTQIFWLVLCLCTAETLKLSLDFTSLYILQALVLPLRYSQLHKDLWEYKHSFPFLWYLLQ